MIIHIVAKVIKTKSFACNSSGEEQRRQGQYAAGEEEVVALDDYHAVIMYLFEFETGLLLLYHSLLVGIACDWEYVETVEKAIDNGVGLLHMIVLLLITF